VSPVMNAQSMTRRIGNQNAGASCTRKAWLAGMGLLVAGCLDMGAVTLISDHRSVSVAVQAPSSYVMNPNSGTTDTPYAQFADAHLNASGSVCWQDMAGWTPAPTSGSVRQDATLTPNQIGMNTLLFVSVGGDPYGVHCAPGASGTAWASSVFEIQFSVANPTQYDYLFDFTPTSTLTTASLFLTSANSSQQLFRTSGTPATGILDPGTYTLHYEFASRATGAQAGYSSSSFMFNFTPELVPEPSAFAVFGMGLIALGVLHRKGPKPQLAPARANRRRA